MKEKWDATAGAVPATFTLRHSDNTLIRRSQYALMIPGLEFCRRREGLFPKRGRLPLTLH